MSAQRPLFLTSDELKHLTGFAHAKRQAEWLRQKNIFFFLNGFDQPVVMHSTLLSAQTGGRAEKSPRPWAPVFPATSRNVKSNRGRP